MSVQQTIKKTPTVEPAYISVKDRRLDDVDQEVDDTAPSVSYFSIFRYATKWDKLRIFLALLSAVITGVVLPFNTIVFADITNAMVIYGITLSMNVTVPNAEEDFYEAVKWFGIYNTILGTILVVFTYTATVLMNHTAFNQIYKIRKEYMRAALNQDISWYDLNESGDFASRMSEDLVKLEDGMGEKITNFVHFIVGFISSVVMALIRGWKLALVCLTSFPLTLLCVGTAGAIAARLAKKEAVAYGHAASVAEEVLGSIRTVVAFGGQQKETERFQENLGQAKLINIKRNFFSGLALGALFFCIYATYALSFWYGVKLVIEEPETYTVDIMVSVFFGVMMGSMQFGMMSPLIEVFGVSKGAAAKVFALIDTVPYINAFLDRGVKPSEVLGNITFKNVHFKYPSRDDVPILNGVNLEVKRGQTVALVGTSGCGKSTVIQLIQRFYDPNDGNIHLDGNDIRDLSVNWLRSQIGVVGQEPVLFNTTISENIRYGRDEATQEQIEEAAKKSNAHEFIKQLPKGYETLVGDRGTQLSGGQKQRIAIARALVRNPTILLLDEATSALDTHSESRVQNALDKASEGRTTIIVAHRLSTIRNVDVIYAFKNGSVAETGSHQQLMDMKGIYYDMVMMQNVPSALNNNNDKNLLSKQESIISSQSDTSEDVAREQVVADEESEELAVAVPFLKIVALSKPEWRQLLVACLTSAILGFAMPIFAVLFGEILGVLSNPDRDYVRQQTNFYSLMFVMLGVVTGISNFTTIFLYGIAGERLTERLRRQMFESMLRQEISWFDDKKNSTGALCAKLSSEATYVQGATGQRIGTVMQGVSTLGLGVGLALYYEWRVGLVSFCFTPLIIVVMYRQTLMAISKESGISKTVEKSTKLAIEVISNIRTVASLGREAQFLDQYDAELAPGVRIAQRTTHSRGFVFGLGRGIMNYAFAAAIYYGGTLIVNDGVSYQDVLKTSQALIMSTSSVANMFAFAPNFQRGVFAAGRIINLLKRKPAIVDPTTPAKTVFDATGNVSYEDIHFSYPSRPGVSVLNGLSLAIEPGRTVALVGASGCGKSTVVQLLERFYDPDSGTLRMDGTSTKDLPLGELRKNLGLVQQEPVLFDRSIGDNIAYGDNERTPSQVEIVEAAKKANIHNFITSLPLGYDTRLGSKGTQLSGGQKQRVAIARALLRQPKLLLLDEATSALDVESEKVVQEALDAAKVGRTCITIAHRLFTVQDADVICVLQGGRVAEMGRHEELVNARGIYYRLQLRSTI